MTKYTALGLILLMGFSTSLWARDTLSSPNPVGTKVGWHIGIGSDGIEIQKRHDSRWCRQHPDRCERNRYREYRDSEYDYQSDYCATHPWACEGGPDR